MATLRIHMSDSNRITARSISSYSEGSASHAEPRSPKDSVIKFREEISEYAREHFADEIHRMQNGEKINLMEM